MQIDIGYASGSTSVDFALIADNKAEEIILELFKRCKGEIIVKSYIPARLVMGKGENSEKVKFSKKIKHKEHTPKRSYRDKE